METKIETFLAEGKIRKEDTSLSFVEALIREAVVDLDEARKTQEIGAHRATFFLSYQSMLRAGRALLLLHGYKPANSAQHKTIVQITSLLMGERCHTITEHVEKALHKQDDLICAGSNLLSEIEAHDAFHYALLLVREVVKQVRSKDSNFHVDL